MMENLNEMWGGGVGGAVKSLLQGLTMLLSRAAHWNLHMYLPGGIKKKKLQCVITWQHYTETASSS